MTSPDAAEEPAVSSGGDPAPADPAPGAPGFDAAVPAGRVAPRGEPILPEQSPEDTDAAWGEYRPRDDDRLYQDRPPHWADY
jgi:hypothetical protein